MPWLEVLWILGSGVYGQRLGCDGIVDWCVEGVESKGGGGLNPGSSTLRAMRYFDLPSRRHMSSSVFPSSFCFIVDI